MEITVEQLQELIFEEEQIKEIAQKQSERLDYEASVELMERVMNAVPIQPEEREKVSRLDRIIYAVRGAYIFGYMSAVDTLNDAMRAFVADFIGGVHSSPNSLQADTEPCRA
mgnify:CR=1 FL=1